MVANYQPVLLSLLIAVCDSPGHALEKRLLSSVLNSLFVGELFAQAPIDQYPGIAVETVTDSSRYFVIRIQDGTGELSCVCQVPGWRTLNPMKLCICVVD